MTRVVDASVAVKLFVAEADSNLAELLLDRTELLVAPAHFLGEVGQVVVQRRRMKQISLAQMAIVRNVLPNLAVLEPLPGIFDNALQIASDIGMSFYDALYIGTAERWNTVVVTADMKMIAALKPTRWSRRAISLAEWANRRTGR
jgi:predicted nucleic acid-binding protein